MDLDSSPEILPNSIYKIYQLNSEKKPKKIIVFHGKREPVTSLNEIFSEIEIAEIGLYQTEIKYSQQLIHKDDSIQTIKKKIMIELDANIVSLEEIYMFSKIRDNLHLMKFYQDFTQNDKIEFKSEMLGQLLRNLFSGDSEKALSLIESIPKKDVYSYEDLANYLDLSIDYEITIPIGQKFSSFRDLLFSADPYDILSSNPPVFQQTTMNSIFTFENHLLLNYGDLIDNKIFVCLTGDVLEYSLSNGIEDEYIIRIYYPLLEKADILSRVVFEEKKQELILNNRELIKSDVLTYYDRIDMFYDIQRNKTAELKYLKQGITTFTIILHPEFKVFLPLEAIFKNIHATKLVPFIKYNPGSKRENLYRLYSEKISKSGKKIPVLKKSQILNLSKQIGRVNQISLFIQASLDSVPIEIFLDFENNGNIIVNCDLKEQIDRDDILRILLGPVNSIINETNDFLLQTGYKMNMFYSLKDDFVEIINIKYVTEISLMKPFQFVDGIGCLTSIFDVIDTNLKKGAILRYKRVENFKKMDTINTMIAEMYSRNGDISSIVNSLILNYDLSRDEALLRFEEFLNQYTRIQGRFVNKSVDIAENPGFPAIFRIVTFENKLSIEIDKIKGIDYVELLKIYLDSYLRISQAPETIGVSMEDVKRICSKIEKQSEVTESYQDNVIVTNKIVAPVIDYENEKGDKEDDEDDGLMPIEDEEIEDIGLMPIEDYEYDDDEDDGMMPMDEEDEEDEEDQNDENEENIEQGDINPIEETENEENENDDESEGMVPMEEDEQDEDADELDVEQEELPEEESEEMQKIQQKGGAKGSLPEDIKPAKLFNDKLKRLEPTLILTRKEGKYDSYSRACPVAVNRQPVILTDAEKQNIDKNHRDAYGYALRFGTNPDKKYWYICPRFWCMKTNTPLTKEQVDAGECAGSVHEFTSNKHLDKDGKYVNHNPGFLPEDSHPTSCLPCCFKKDWNSNQLEMRRDTCDIKQDDIDLPPGVELPQKQPIKKREPEEMEDNLKLYVVSFDKYPIPKNRWGFLPPSIQLFLRLDYNQIINKKNPALLKPNKTTFLRYGVEQSRHQSFIGCIADIFGYVNRYKEENKQIPSIKEMRNILTRAITIDMYIKYHNASLVAIFQPPKKRIEQIVLNKYTASEFFNSLDPTNEQQMDFFEDTVASFENFLMFLRDDDSWIDHTYLWDVVTSNNPKLFPGGLNLVILNIVDNDITDNVEVLCPTNSYSERFYDPRRETVILLKHDDFYEPIYLFEHIIDDDINVVKSTETFSEQIAMPNLKKILKIIQNTSKYCKSQPSMPKVYKMKQNISASELSGLLKSNEYIIESQVMNYRGKIIGFNVSLTSESNKPIFIPCFPSAYLQNIKIMMMDDINWQNYQTTRDSLSKINQETESKILCKPVFKVVEKEEANEIGIIVGILTETNQFIQTDPPIANDIEDGLEEFVTQSYGNGGYLSAEKSLTISNKMDTTRIDAIKNISLESQFYKAFRTTLRIQLNEHGNREIRKSLVDLLDDSNFTYHIKIKKILILLKYLLRNSVSFNEIDSELLSNIKEISTCTTKCETKSYCLIRDDDTCSITIPNKNLITGEDNEKIYYIRLADELLRYKRIRLFLLEPKKYLNIANVEYNLNDSELLLLQSILESDYFDDLIPFQTNKYVESVTYDLAIPSISQKYEQIIPLDKQSQIGSENMNMEQYVVECVKENLKSVIGNQDSYWKKVIPTNAKEIVYNDSIICSYYVLIDILQRRSNYLTTVQTLKSVLWRKYSMYMDKHKNKIIELLSIQGKNEMMKRVKTSRITLEQLIMSEEYFLTNLDLWALASFFELPILLFSTKPLQNLLLNVNWVILGGNRETDKYFCVRSPSVSKKIPEYHLITPSFGLNELKGFDGMINNTEYAENNLSFETYLDTHQFEAIKNIGEI